MRHIIDWDTDRYTVFTGKIMIQSPNWNRNAAIPGVELSSKVYVKSSRNEAISLKLNGKEKLVLPLPQMQKSSLGRR